MSLAVFILRRHYPSGRTCANICIPIVVRRSRRITKDTSSRHIVRSVPVFILKTHNQTKYKCLHKFVQTLKEHENVACDDSNESLYLAKKIWRKNMALDPCLNFSLYKNSRLGSTRGTPSESVAAPTSLQSRIK